MLRVGAAAGSAAPAAAGAATTAKAAGDQSGDSGSAPSTVPQLVVADSFRVRLESGVASVNGFSLHLERFTAAVCAAAGTSAEELTAFIAEARAAIAAYGEGFPRLELWLTGDRFELALALRPLPTLGTSIAMRSAAVPADVATPSVKGPNIARYGALLRELGCEALLIDADGRAVEGTTTSLVWRDGDVLHVVATTDRVPSVSERLVIDYARAAGLKVVSESIAPERLALHEVIAVNALHGARPVTSIDGAVPPFGDLNEFASRAFEAAAEPILS